MPDRTRRDIDKVADVAAEKAVDKLARLLLGVDITDQDQINEYRADQMHLRKMRRLYEKGGLRIFMLVLTVVILGGAGMLWSGFRDVVGK